MTDFDPLTPTFVTWGKIPRLNRELGHALVDLGHRTSERPARP